MAVQGKATRGGARRLPYRVWRARASPAMAAEEGGAGVLPPGPCLGRLAAVGMPVWAREGRGADEGEAAVIYVGG